MAAVAGRPAASNDLSRIQTKRIGQGVMTGVVAGALLGGLLTAVAGGNGNQIAQNAVLGAAVGGAGGAIFAAGVNKSAQQQSSEQDRYRQVIADADTNIESYRRASNLANTVASAERERVTQLNARLAAGEITASAYRSQLSSARANVASIDRLITDANKDINDMTTLIGNTGNGGLAARRAALVQQKTDLTERRRLLLDAYSRVPAEVGINV